MEVPAMVHFREILLTHGVVNMGHYVLIIEVADSAFDIHIIIQLLNADLDSIDFSDWIDFEGVHIVYNIFDILLKHQCKLPEILKEESIGSCNSQSLDEIISKSELYYLFDLHVISPAKKTIKVNVNNLTNFLLNEYILEMSVAQSNYVAKAAISCHRFNITYLNLNGLSMIISLLKEEVF